MSQVSVQQEQGVLCRPTSILSLNPCNRFILLCSYAPSCGGCHQAFKPLTRLRHHCRLCGKVFCANCSKQRKMMPPHFRWVGAHVWGGGWGKGGGLICANCSKQCKMMPPRFR
jgi:hypothetical protein